MRLVREFDLVANVHHFVLRRVVAQRTHQIHHLIDRDKAGNLARRGGHHALTAQLRIVEVVQQVLVELPVLPSLEQPHVRLDSIACQSNRGL